MTSEVCFKMHPQSCCVHRTGWTGQAEPQRWIQEITYQSNLTHRYIEMYHAVTVKVSFWRCDSAHNQKYLPSHGIQLVLQWSSGAESAESAQLMVFATSIADTGTQSTLHVLLLSTACKAKKAPHTFLVHFISRDLKQKLDPTTSGPLQQPQEYLSQIFHLTGHFYTRNLTSNRMAPSIAFQKQLC